jgi:hypothetical protein
MPDFLKNFFIRQYGLKSIALKNLANLAAGKEEGGREAEEEESRSF